jgi:1,2-diacylglycerol 3-alpha-glucosyltransferase
MKIAIFTEYYFPFISGVVTHIKTLKDELERAGNQVLIVTTDPKSNHHYIKDNVLYCPAKSVKKIYGYGVTFPMSHSRLKFIKEFNPDIIHIHTEFTVGYFGVWAAHKLKKPIVYTLHTMYDDYTFYLFPEKFDKYAKLLTHKYIGYVAKEADQIIGPSLKVIEFLRRCNVNKHVNIIPNVTDLTLFLPENVNFTKVEEIKETYNLNENSTALCFVGRLGKEKSIDTLLKYFAKACENNKNLKLFIIGDGPEKQSLNRLTKLLNIEDNVVFVGKVKHEDIAAFYFASDIYATASLSEMNSISMLEAMASGLMVFQRMDIYNKYQIEEGKSGYLFQDSEDFCRLLNDYSSKTAEEKKEIRETAVAYSRKYGPKEFVNKVLDVYELAIHEYSTKN